MHAPLPRDPQALLEHSEWMRRLALRLLGDPAAADDVVQDATLAALGCAPAADRPIEPWLSRVVRNLALRRRRAEARRGEHEARAGQPKISADPTEALERLDAARALLDAVRELDGPLRAAVVLHFLEGRTSAEIARAESLPAGTVRWRLKRALEVLRERLDRRYGSRANWAALLAPIAFQPPAGSGPASSTQPGLEPSAAATSAALPRPFSKERSP